MRVGEEEGEEEWSSGADRPEVYVRPEKKIKRFFFVCLFLLERGLMINLSNSSQF